MMTKVAKPMAASLTVESRMREVLSCGAATAVGSGGLGAPTFPARSVNCSMWLISRATGVNFLWITESVCGADAYHCWLGVQMSATNPATAASAVIRIKTAPSPAADRDGTGLPPGSTK